VQRNHFGRELALIPVDALDLRVVLRTFNEHPERKRWQRVPNPKHGDAVLMRQSRYPVHVGVWLDVDGGGVLHCAHGVGVVFQDLLALDRHGWRAEGFYAFRGEPCQAAMTVS
jgi:hypothetical protein